jgi:hypothetical protein
MLSLLPNPHPVSISTELETLIRNEIMSGRAIHLALGDINVVEQAMHTLSEPEWIQSLHLIRKATATLEQQDFFARHDRPDAQIRAVAQVQAVSYREPELDAVVDLSRWCLDKWLLLDREHPQHVDILKGARIPPPLDRFWTAAACGN